MRTCTTCNTPKPHNKFRFRRDRNSYVSTCRKCENSYRRKLRDRFDRLTINLRLRYGVRIKSDILRAVLGEPANCYICGDPINGDAELDHVIPRSLGGPTEIENLRWSHRRCNRMKHDLTIEEFLKTLIKILQHQHQIGTP